MTDELFARINKESAIQIVQQDKPYKPGYFWQWQSWEWQIRNGGVFESQEAALISAINHMNETYKTTVANCLESMDLNERLKEEIKFLEKLLDSKENWELTFFIWTFACTGFTGLLLGFVVSFLRFQ